MGKELLFFHENIRISLRTETGETKDNQGEIIDINTRMLSGTFYY